ncbi:MAG: hypothetical protein LUC22_05665 [Prevotella sp.]|nr:hypothetical protein [Prevotella sp.]
MRHLRKINLIICICIYLLSTVSGTVHAQYYSVNYDKETVAAMVAAYAAGTATETYYNECVEKILKHYTSAEVAAAGIFASKYLDRRALTDTGRWSSSTENYYYRRIYKLVSEKIIPKIWTVAGLMLKSPQTALYWSSYLMKVCQDTKSLCMQFESVVTNGSLSFSDITLLEIGQDVCSVLKLSELGGTDWQQLLDDISSMSADFTADNLTADINTLYTAGVLLATAGTGNIEETLLQQNAFHNLFSGKTSAIKDIYNSYHGLYESMESDAGATLLSMIGGEDNVAGLFDISGYDMAAWTSDYASDSADTYYTQRWYIARRDQGSESLCDYYPPTDDTSIISGGEWTRYSTSDAAFYPSSTQLEEIRSNSESYAGWSQTAVNQLNNQNDGFTYGISYILYSYVINKNGKQTKKAYAYEIHATKSWDNVEEVYEDVFDSYSMDFDTFKAQLQVRLDAYNGNEDGYVYYIASDGKNYYQAANEAKMAGCESVTFSVTCNDSVSLASGNTQYKCNTCGSSLNSHTKECAMLTTVSENELDLSELDRQQSDVSGQITAAQTRIDVLERENTQLLEEIGNADADDATAYRQQYNENKSEIETLEAELTALQQELSDINAAIEEAAGDDDVETDDYYRIPAIMEDCKTAYGLTWQSEGSWSGYTYTRKATLPNINGVITFTASLSIARKPKYFLGIKIHRAIVQISWELATEYSDTSVVDIITFSGDKSDTEKANEVNEHLSEIAREYPSCSITTEYAASDTPGEDGTDDTRHLLWASDRLDVAREVDSRLTKIYADLVSLEKMMSYKRTIIDVLKDVAPYVNAEQGRRLTLVEECRQRWLGNAAQSMHSSGYNGKYNREEE